MTETARKVLDVTDSQIDEDVETAGQIIDAMEKGGLRESGTTT